MRLASSCACVLALASLSSGWLAGCESTDSQDESGHLSEERGRSSAARRGSLDIRAFETAGDAGVEELGDAGIEETDASAVPDESTASEDAGLDYSDRELVAMVVAIHEAETLLARAAALGATDPRLKRLATDVADAHQEGSARSLLLGLLPVPSQQSRDYLESGLGLRAHVRSEEPGESFDRAYLECQILLNAILIHHIDSLWLPMADSPELQSELKSTRDTMQTHMDSAVALRGELFPPAGLDSDAGTSAPSDPDGGVGEAPASSEDSESSETLDAGRESDAGEEAARS